MNPIKRFFPAVICLFLWAIPSHLVCQDFSPLRLSDTGQRERFTQTQGEDADYLVNPLSFTDNGDGTITDLNTGLMWQKTDGGEMTFEAASVYCSNLTLAGYSDWRLPTGMELFGINDHQNNHPAINTLYFPKTAAEYWWSCETEADDPSKIWVVNAGGGIGAHPKTETISAGGTRIIHTRAVRDLITRPTLSPRFSDKGDGTIYDNLTGLTWLKSPATSLMNWEAALNYAEGLTFGGKTDWRLPNIKELQSLNDPSRVKPSFNTSVFSSISSGNFWSSTTLEPQPGKAWDINVDFGIVSYTDKTASSHVLCVRGGSDVASLNISEAQIPGGEYEMGDHFGFVDPQHPSDEIPIHTVRVDSFNMAKTEATNQQFLTFLNSKLLAGEIEVRNNKVYRTGDTLTLCFTHEFESWYSISWNGNNFTMADFRADHPMVGVMWTGAALFCNWLSSGNGLQECYNTSTWDCDFTKNGYRLPTEAEWEFAARGGHLNPYFNYANGNTVVPNMANLPQSGDPYETGSYPNTTPAGFYDGALKQKTAYNWPGSAASYQTTDGVNGYGLYDVQGNVWELINDWYGQNYYSVSPYNNPTGPASGFIMPDGKPYRGMRGGNWYNGYTSGNVNDGHSRVSNRNPSYYRGPQDPNHPWYHVGFRIARKYSANLGINGHPSGSADILHFYNFPNPIHRETNFRFYLPASDRVLIQIMDLTGHVLACAADGEFQAGWNTLTWNSAGFPGGLYIGSLTSHQYQSTIKLIMMNE